MSIFSSYKKIFLLGFTLVILIAIPFSVYIAQKRQRTITKAAASTVLSLEPGSATVKTGETVVLNIMLDPGTGASANQVSFVKLSINFDSSKFTTLPDSLKANPESPNTLTTIIDDPKYESGKASISLSIGADPTRAIVAKTKIAIFQLKATEVISPSTPNITFDTVNTQVLSIASSDQTSENVLSTTAPAKVTVTAAATNTSPTPSSSPTSAPATPITPAPTSSPAPKIGGLPSSSLAPACSGLDVNGLTNGTAPYSLTFTATGRDSDGIISKVSFNFGDTIEDLTAGGGIGTSSVSAQMLHTYKTPGIYTAYAILTDNNNNLSAQQINCTKTITVNSTDLSGSPQPSPTIIAPLPPTGDGKIIFGLGAIGIIFTIIGGALLLL